MGEAVDTTEGVTTFIMAEVTMDIIMGTVLEVATEVTT